MANISLRKNTEPNVVPRSVLSSFLPTTWGRSEPFRLVEDLLRWDPFREMAPALGAAGLAFVPDFEIEETPDRYTFRGDLPGLSESDIEISVTGNRLTISGQREAERKEENANYYCRERSYGTFSRSFTLPTGADVDNIKADLKKGVLTIEVPKSAEAQPRRIALQGGESKDSKQARA